jgi:hypothetical protein
MKRIKDMEQVVTTEQVKALLDAEEPDYARAAKLGPRGLPILLQFVQGDDLMLASKATYLASLIQDDAALDVVWAAARSPVEIVRVAAAGGLRNMKPPPSLIQHLLRDDDAGVRGTTLRSIFDNDSSIVREHVEHIAKSDPLLGLRDLASNVLDNQPDRIDST